MKKNLSGVMHNIITFILVIVFIVFTGTSCYETTDTRKDIENTLNVGNQMAPNEVYKCVDELLEYIQPDGYVWSYDLMEGETNLDVDFICKIEIFYSDENDEYYSIFVCYIEDDDVDWERIR